MRSFALTGLAALFVSPVVWADEPKTASNSSAGTGQSGVQDRKPDPSVAKRYAALRAEYEAEQLANREAVRKAAPGAGGERAEPRTRSRDLIVDYSRRMIELAESSLGDPGARDALVWVINQPGRADRGEFGEVFGRAGFLLVRYYGDDPEAIRVGLMLDHQVSPRRDTLLLGFYATAKGHEAKGLARLALAQYLAFKSKQVAYARSIESQPKTKAVNQGKAVRKRELTTEDLVRTFELRQFDPEAIHNEAVRLFEELISEFSDIPYVTRSRREFELLLKEPNPQRRGKLLTDADRRAVENMLARKKTLGQQAQERLDELLNLAVGKPAPEIEGVDFGGKPLKLSDYKGKVVMLVFWGTWCGPCMGEVPHERDLVERFKDKPFAMLGVDCEPDKEMARAVMEREKMTWPNWFDGAPGTGPIATRYHVRGYPTVYLIDGKGMIRHTTRAGLDQNIEKLLDELKGAAAGSTSLH
jgi:thiol-disulfide isomerase/thioredoxin